MFSVYVIYLYYSSIFISVFTGCLNRFNIYILCTSLSFAYVASSLMSVVIQGVIKEEGWGSISVAVNPSGIYSVH